DFIVSPTTWTSVPNAVTDLNNSATVQPAKPLGLKVELPLSNTDASTLFNSHYPQPSGPKAISYVWADFESGSPAYVLANVTTLVNQVRTSTWSKQAYVGQYGLTPVALTDDKARRVTPPGPN